MRINTINGSLCAIVVSTASVLGTTGTVTADCCHGDRIEYDPTEDISVFYLSLSEIYSIAPGGAACTGLDWWDEETDTVELPLGLDGLAATNCLPGVELTTGVNDCCSGPNASAGCVEITTDPAVCVTATPTFMEVRFSGTVVVDVDLNDGVAPGPGCTPENDPTPSSLASAGTAQIEVTIPFVVSADEPNPAARIQAALGDTTIQMPGQTDELIPVSSLQIDLTPGCPESDWEILSSDPEPIDHTCRLSSAVEFYELKVTYYCILNGDLLATCGALSSGHATLNINALVTMDISQGCVADLDLDGDVDTDDLLQLMSKWGACVCCPEDLNCDGFVDVDDLLAIYAVWGPCP